MNTSFKAAPSAIPERPWVGWLVLGAILLISMAVRFRAIDIGIAEGLCVHDEIIEVQRAFSLLRGNIDGLPGPKGVFFLLTAVAYAVWGGVSVVSGEHESFSEFVSAQICDPFGAVLIGRYTSALLDVLSVVLLFVIGRRIFRSHLAAWALSLAWAVCPIAVWLAHWSLVEPCLVTASLLFYLSALNLAERRRRRDYVLAALWLAVAAATKTYGAGLLSVLWGAHFLGRAQDSGGESATGSVVAQEAPGSAWRTILLRARSPRFWAANVLVVVFFALIAPLMVIFALQALGVMRAPVAFFVNSDLPKTLALPQYLVVLRWNLGNAIVPFVLLGGLVALRSRHWPVALSFLFAVQHTLSLGCIPTSAYIYDRYMLIALPFLLIAGIHGAQVIGEFLGRRRATWRVGLSAAAFAVFAGLSVHNGVSSLVRVPILGARPVPIEATALHWVETHVPARSRVLMDGISLWPFQNPLSLWDLPEKYQRLHDEVVASGQPLRFSHMLPDLARCEKEPRYDLELVGRQESWRTLEEYRKLGIEYVVQRVGYVSTESVEFNRTRDALEEEFLNSPHVHQLQLFEGQTFQGQSRSIRILRIDPLVGPEN